MSPARPLPLDESQRERRQQLVRAGTTPQKVARRARIVLLAAEGLPNQAIAARVGTSLNRPGFSGGSKC